MGQNAIVFVGREVHRVDDIIGIEIRAVMEFNALTKFDFHRDVVFPLPLGREKGLEFTCLRIAEQQAVPAHVAHNDQFTRIVVVRIDNGNFAVRRPVQRVVGFTGECWT